MKKTVKMGGGAGFARAPPTFAVWGQFGIDLGLFGGWVGGWVRCVGAWVRGWVLRGMGT